jgi:hypothetical protein
MDHRQERSIDTMGHGVKSMVRALSLAAVLGLCGGSAMAFQVAGGVDNAAVAAIALDAGQKAAVDKLVSDNLAGLSSAKAVDVMKSRRAILEPMMVPQVQIGVGYRVYLTSKLVEPLRPLVGGKSEESAINALVISGELATQQAVELLQLGMKSTLPAVRKAAAYGMQRTFMALSNHQAAMLQPVADGMITTIQEQLKSESDAQVVLALVQAGLEASKLRGVNGQFNLTNAAIEATCKGLSARATLKGDKALDNVELQALLNAMGGARDTVGGRGGVNVPTTVHLAAAELAGTIVAHSRRVVSKNGIEFSDASAREMYGLACDTATRLAETAGGQLKAGTPFPQVKLSESLRKGDKLNDGAFLKGCDDAIGALSKEPFNFNAAMFK